MFNQEEETGMSEYDKATLIAGGAIPMLAGLILGEPGTAAKVAGKAIMDREESRQKTLLEAIKASQKSSEDKKYQARDVVKDGDVFAGRFNPYSGVTDVPESAPQIKLDPNKYDIKEKVVVENGKSVVKQFFTDKTNPSVSGSRVLGEAPKSNAKQNPSYRDREQKVVTTDADGNPRVTWVKPGQNTVIPGGSFQEERKSSNEAKDIAEWEAKIGNNFKNLEILEKHIDKKDIPGIGTAETLFGYRPEFTYTDKDKVEVRTAAAGLLRAEALETGGKNLTPNEKKMVQDAIGLMDGGNEKQFKNGIKKYREALDSYAKRIRSGFTPRAKVKFEKGMGSQEKRSLKDIQSEKEKLKAEIEALSKKK